MDIRHQVFVSSTFRDLVEERREVMQALLELDCIPAGMELFPASNETALKLIKEMIEQSDYYIVIVGGRYGSTDADGVSYTEIEYDYAVSIDKPVLGFLHRNPDSIPAGATELDPEARKRLEGFRAKVEQRYCKYWETAAELGGVVSRSLVQERKRSPRPGWVRADGLGDPDTLEHLVALQAENVRLNDQLDGLLGNPLPGTDELEQGQDVVCVTIGYRYHARDPMEYYSQNLSWDEIISLVGPLMLQEAGEESVDGCIANRVAQAGRQAGVLLEDAMWPPPKLIDDSRAMIIVQLMALGIIEKSIRKRSLSDTSIYWKLTAYGERCLTRLRARRRPGHTD